MRTADVSPRDEERAATPVSIERKGILAKLSLRDLWDYRELIYFFVWRDLKVRYKQTVVGLFWVVIEPLLMMGLFAVIFGVLVSVPTDGIPRPVFFFSALIPFTYFRQALTASTGSVVANRTMVTKVYFPRVILPVAVVIPGLVDVCISFMLLFGMLFLFDITPGPNLAYAPLFLSLAVATALAVGLWLSNINARYRDVRRSMNFLTQLWFYASPVIYPPSVVPERFRDLYFLNPMAGVIAGFRWAVTGRGARPSSYTFIAAAAVIVLLISGLWYFRKSETKIVDFI